MLFYLLLKLAISCKKGGSTMKTDVEQLTISLRDAQVRYGLSRTSLTKIGKENDALVRIGNKYLLFVDRMDKAIKGRIV